MPKSHRPHNHTNLFLWCAGILCAIIAVLVIIAGIVLFFGYLTIKPKIPQVSVASANLDAIYFDQASLLIVQVTILTRAENNNNKAIANFYNMTFALTLGGGRRIAYLVADPFSLAPNKSVEFSYMSQSGAIPLNPEEVDAVSLSVKRGVMNFGLSGTAKSGWRFGFVHSFKFTLHLNCQLQLPIDGTPVYPHCSSKAK